MNYSTYTPPSAEKAELKLVTRLNADSIRIGETIRMEVTVTNTRSSLQPMAIAKIGIPAGLSVQPWQLKEFIEKINAPIMKSSIITSFFTGWVLPPMKQKHSDWT